MFARRLAFACALLASCSPAEAQRAYYPSGPPRSEFLAQCEGKEGWADPAPPVRIHSVIYDVGTCGIVVLLLPGPDGHILLDSGPAEAAPLVAANIQALGFRLEDIKWIGTSHAHHDHVGGVAELQRLTGARLVALASAKRSLETGEYDPADPQFGINPPFPPARVDRVVEADEELVVEGHRLTILATPGHSPSSTSWAWRMCPVGGPEEDCLTIAYVDSITAVSAESYRFSDHPEYVAEFRRTLDKIEALDCGLLITPHPSASGLFERLAGERPVVSEGACKRYAEAGRRQLDERLAREAAGG